MTEDTSHQDNTTGLNLSWEKHHNTICESFEEFLQANTFVDCTISAEGQCLKAHKMVLSACSPYFQILFAQEKEKHHVVVLKDVLFCNLKDVIHFMYSGKVILPYDRVIGFLEVAKDLQIRGLEKYHQLKKRVSKKSAVQSTQEAMTFELLLSMDNLLKRKTKNKHKRKATQKENECSGKDERNDIEIIQDNQNRNEMDENTGVSGTFPTESGRNYEITPSQKKELCSLSKKKKKRMTLLKKIKLQSSVKNGCKLISTEIDEIQEVRADAVDLQPSCSESSERRLLDIQNLQESELVFKNDISHEELSNKNFSTPEKELLSSSNICSAKSQSSFQSVDGTISDPKLKTCVVVLDRISNPKNKDSSENSVLQYVLPNQMNMSSKCGELSLNVSQDQKYDQPMIERQIKSHHTIVKQTEVSEIKEHALNVSAGKVDAQLNPSSAAESIKWYKNQNKKHLRQTNQQNVNEHSFSCVQSKIVPSEQEDTNLDCNILFESRTVSLAGFQELSPNSRPNSQSTLSSAKKCYKQAKKSKKIEKINTTGWPCLVCNKVCKASDELIPHMKRHSRSKCHQCLRCGLTFLKICTFIAHKAIHASEKSFDCRMCGQVFYNVESLNEHLQMHKKDMFSCTKCGKGFSLEQNCRNHMKSHSRNSSIQFSQCNVCGKVVSDKFSLEEHKKEIHGKDSEKHFNSEIAGKSLLDNAGIEVICKDQKSCQESNPNPESSVLFKLCKNSPKVLKRHRDTAFACHDNGNVSVQLLSNEGVSSIPCQSPFSIKNSQISSKTNPSYNSKNVQVDSQIECIVVEDASTKEKIKSNQNSTPIHPAVDILVPKTNNVRILNSSSLSCSSNSSVNSTPANKSFSSQMERESCVESTAKKQKCTSDPTDEISSHEQLGHFECILIDEKDDEVSQTAICTVLNNKSTDCVILAENGKTLESHQNNL